MIEKDVNDVVDKESTGKTVSLTESWSVDKEVDEELVSSMRSFVAEQVGLEQYGDEETLTRLNEVKIFQVSWDKYEELRILQFPGEHYTYYSVPDASTSPEAFYISVKNCIIVKKRPQETAINEASCIMGLVAAARSMTKCQDVAKSHDTFLDKTFQAYVAQKWIEQKEENPKNEMIPLVLNHSGLPLQFGIFSNKYISENATQIPVYLPLMDLFEALTRDERNFNLFKQTRFGEIGEEDLQNLMGDIDPLDMHMWEQRIFQEFDDLVLTQVYDKAKQLRQAIGLEPIRYQYDSQDRRIDSILQQFYKRIYQYGEVPYSIHPTFSPEIDFGNLGSAIRELEQCCRRYYEESDSEWVLQFETIVLIAAPTELMRLLVRPSQKQMRSYEDQLVDNEVEERKNQQTRLDELLEKKIDDIYLISTSKFRTKAYDRSASKGFRNQYFERKGLSLRDNILLFIELLCQEQDLDRSGLNNTRLIYFLRAVAGAMNLDDEESASKWIHYQELVMECGEIFYGSPHKFDYSKDPDYYDAFINCQRLTLLLNQCGYLQDADEKVLRRIKDYLELAGLEHKSKSWYAFYRIMIGRSNETYDLNKIRIDQDRANELKSMLGVNTVNTMLLYEVKKILNKLFTDIYTEISEQLLTVAMQDAGEPPNETVLKVIKKHEPEISRLVSFKI